MLVAPEKLRSPLPELITGLGTLSSLSAPLLPLHLEQLLISYSCQNIANRVGLAFLSLFTHQSAALRLSFLSFTQDF
jgi:hypothetical protein